MFSNSSYQPIPSIYQNNGRPVSSQLGQNNRYQLSGNLQQELNQLEDDVQGHVGRQTHLIQVYTNNPDDGPRLISDYHPKGVPLMVLVDQPCCCFCKLNVPHGIVTLEQENGKQTGVLKPGPYWCYCNYKKIAAMITKNSIRFSTPIERCPTKDNVKVSVDIGIIFRIGKDEQNREEDCQKFLYYLGANKLQELLEQECEETIRNFIRKIKVSKIRDIKSELATEMLHILNAKFNKLGVFMESVNVINVIIPKDMRVALATATTYDVLLQNQIKYQENLKLKLNNEQNKQLLKLKRQNMKQLDVLNHQKTMAEIELEQTVIQIETEQKLAIINAQSQKSVQLIRAEGIKNQAQTKAQKTAESILAEAKAYFEQKKIEADNISSNLTAKAKVRLESAQFTSQSLTHEAEVEEKQVTNLENKRKFDEKIKHTLNLVRITRRNQIVIGGESGDYLLEFFKDTNDLVFSDKKL